MKLKIEITNVKGGSVFTGWLDEVGKLPEDFRAKYNILPDDDIRVEGDVSVCWDYDLPMPFGENIGIIVNGEWILLDDDYIDHDSLDEQLSKWDCQEWYEERSASLADNPYSDLER